MLVFLRHLYSLQSASATAPSAAAASLRGRPYPMKPTAEMTDRVKSLFPGTQLF